ncbi:MAG TPA: TatD family hydrolase [Gammaproteobacteria bacterium]|nr:TatD family hydrolase [Gammaproteobacteria bacterium]
MTLIDIGANLTHHAFDTDRDSVISRARDVGVGVMIVTGSTVEVSRKALALARAHPRILYATAGIHPHHAGQAPADASEVLRALYRSQETVAIGECGLDTFRNFSTPDDQERVFRSQLELACELKAPVFLHQRDAHERFMSILREYAPRLPRAVAHCFTGNARELEDCLALGLYIGLTGWICDERRGAHLRSLVGRIPADRLMIESDAPYLLPRDLEPRPKSRRNEPAHLPHVLAAVAAGAQRDIETLARETTTNARRFFALDALI